ncbi:hypothetical protein [Pectobacterium odoriferum]|uniref:hypothetical protein n=1 Tax=Pectobacterium odoriferum TaxID=78398 RepID=UPI000D4D6434|nr:hypothetical protein [Pectobacterium odoriferum]MBA0190747.1 hypothetical protein [Pectobacterium odoriferum]MCA6963354.1 hypothetical protein [Pectobacterium odoriferum]MCH5011441.1 hypothetical protein [Pectobacterium odoriferum]POE34651.1 hypothetical protein BV922_11780 [Pectobacterium odoriferum]
MKKITLLTLAQVFLLAILIIYSVVGFVFLYGEYLRSGYAALLLMAYIVFFLLFSIGLNAIIISGTYNRFPLFVKHGWLCVLPFISPLGCGFYFLFNW